LRCMKCSICEFILVKIFSDLNTFDFIIGSIMTSFLSDEIVASLTKNWLTKAFADA
jgi:hypothetical protein